MFNSLDNFYMFCKNNIQYNYFPFEKTSFIIATILTVSYLCSYPNELPYRHGFLSWISTKIHYVLFPGLIVFITQYLS